MRLGWSGIRVAGFSLQHNYSCYKSNYAINSYFGRLSNWWPALRIVGQVTVQFCKFPGLYVQSSAYQRLTELSVLLPAVPCATSVPQYMPIRRDYGFCYYIPLHYSLYKGQLH